MWKKIVLAVVALLGIAGAAHADEFYRGDRYERRAPFVRVDRDDYWRMRERARFDRMRNFRWEREHGRYGRRW